MSKYLTKFLFIVQNLHTKTKKIADKKNYNISSTIPNSLIITKLNTVRYSLYHFNTLLFLMNLSIHLLTDYIIFLPPPESKNLEPTSQDSSDIIFSSVTQWKRYFWKSKQILVLKYCQVRPSTQIRYLTKLIECRFWEFDIVEFMLKLFI